MLHQRLGKTVASLDIRRHTLNQLAQRRVTGPFGYLRERFQQRHTDLNEQGQLAPEDGQFWFRNRVQLQPSLPTTRPWHVRRRCPWSDGVQGTHSGGYVVALSH